MLLLLNKMGIKICPDLQVNEGAAEGVGEGGCWADLWNSSVSVTLLQMALGGEVMRVCPRLSRTERAREELH